MLRGKLLIVGIAVSALVVTGCNKKKDTGATKITQTPPVTSNQSSQTKSNESDDIFNEFYKDDKSGSQKENLNAAETFTPSGASTGKRSTRSASGAGFSVNGRYVVQVSTIKSPSLAQRNKNILEEAGYPAYIAEVQNPTPDLNGTYYRLRIGGFSTVAAAREFAENNLKPSGYDYWIDNKSNDNVGLDAGAFGNSGNSYQNDSYVAPSSSSTSTSAPGSSDWGTTSGSTGSSAPGSTTAATPAQTPSSGTATTPAPATTPANEETDSGWGTSGW